MINVQKKQIKTIDDYRHGIQLLKYHLKQQRKKNDNLKYQLAKNKYQLKPSSINTHHIYSLTQSIKILTDRLKIIGLQLEDLFRMADSKYQGEIHKEQFINTLTKLKIQLNDSIFTQMFYAIDTSLNGIIAQDQFIQFSIAYGGCSDSKQIRRYQNKVKTRLANLISKKFGNLSQFLNIFQDPIPIDKFSSQLKNIGLNNNQTMIMLKTFDPSHSGQTTHKLFNSIMQQITIKTQKQQQIQQSTKIINDLCIIFRDKKINPLQIFQQASPNKKNGITEFELEQAFKKIIPDQTTFQIKKWIYLINLNHDNLITKQQFINSIRGFYTLAQICQFQQDYITTHPQQPHLQQQSSQSIQKVIKKLSNIIQDKGMKKKQAFDFIDYNKSGDISQSQLIQGLNSLGININLIGQIMAVFDRDSSNSIQLEEWLRILGADAEMSEVSIPNSVDMDEEMGENIMPQTKPKITIKKTTTQSKKQSVVQPKKQAIVQSKNPQKPPPTLKPKKIDTNITNTKIPQKKLPQKPIPLQTNNQLKKQPKKKAQNKIILNKTFAQDQHQLPSPQIKMKKVNKIIQITSQPKPFQQQHHYSQQNLDKIIDQIQSKLAKQYKQNKKLFIQPFQAQDKTQKNIVNMKMFYSIMRKIDSTLSQQQLKQIFMKYCINGSQINYQQWLEYISELYAQDIPQQQQYTKQPSIDKHSQQNQNDHQKSDEHQHQNPYIQNPTPNINSNLRPTFQQPLRHSTQKSIARSSASQKRGQNLPQFEQLNVLGQITSGTKLQQGYQLFNYISDIQQDQLQSIRTQLLQKAQSIKKNKKLFQDDSFPPTMKSILKDSNKSKIDQLANIKWKHYKQIYRNPQLFIDDVQPNDIRQGWLGNCYFLSALAGLSQYNNLIQRLFQYFDIDNGYFLVWLCIDGFWRLVQIDGYLPVKSKQQTPAFSHSQGQQLWVCILQKAYAKCYGSYNSIVGGQAYQAIKDLTGSPGYIYTHDQKNQKSQPSNKNKARNLYTIQQIWNKLYQANKNQYILTAGTNEQNQQNKISNQIKTLQGLVLGHAYSILDCQIVQGQKLIKLRNPWGNFQWKGKWSDQDKRWTEQLKQKLNYQINQDDGIFWMALPDFFSHFSASTINCIRPTYYYRSAKLQAIQQFMVTIPTKQFTTGYITVSYQDHRHKDIPINTQYDGVYQLLGLISKSDKIIQKYPRKQFCLQRQGSLQFLDINKYPSDCSVIVLINLNKTANITIGFYGDKPAQFQISRQCLKYIQDLAYSQQNNPQTKTHQNMFKLWQPQIQGFIYLCIKNITKNNLMLNINLNKAENVKPVPPFALENKINVKPNQIQSIRLKIVAYPYAYSYGISS